MLDSMVTVGGIVYGVLLVAAGCLRNRHLEWLRIDALMVPRPGERSRLLNPLLGLLLIAYEVHSLLG